MTWLFVFLYAGDKYRRLKQRRGKDTKRQTGKKQDTCWKTMEACFGHKFQVRFFFYFFISTPVRIVSFFIFKKAETSFHRKMGWLIWEIKLIRTSGGQTDDLKKGRNETQAQYKMAKTTLKGKQEVTERQISPTGT